MFLRPAVTLPSLTLPSLALPPSHPPASLLPQGQGLDCVPGTLRLAGPDYRDGSKALQRRLKQLGGGSLAVGLQAVAAGEEEQQELARTLDAEPEVGSGMCVCVCVCVHVREREMRRGGQ